MDDDLDLRHFDGNTRLFPLPGVVLFPHAVLPLHIFEPRYRQMTRDALASDKLIALVQIRPDADWSGPDEPELEQVACLGKIVNHEQLADGRFNILLLGLRRIRLIREVPGATLYRRADVEVLDDEPPGPLEGPRRSELVGLFRGLISPQEHELEALLRSDPPLGSLTDLIAHALHLPPALKQLFLEERRVDRRADGLIAVLRQVTRAAPAPRRPSPPPFSAN